MRRYFEIYKLMIRNSLIREMSFKANFLLWMVVEFLWFVGQMVFLEVLYGQVNSIGGWSKWECVLLVGTHQITSQIFQAFFYMNLSELPELIRSGRLDLMLLLPVDPQFAVSTRKFGMDNIVNALVGVGHRHFLPGQVARCAIGGAGGALPDGDRLRGRWYVPPILFGLATVAFWIVRAQGADLRLFQRFQYRPLPNTVFPFGVFKVIFTYRIPVVMIVANVPRPHFGPGDGGGRGRRPGMQLVVATLFIVAVTRGFWLFALRRYSSASS